MGREKPDMIPDQRIPLHAVNVLPQPRRTFLEIEELADSIALKGLINPITVASYTRQECLACLRVVRQVWGTHITFRGLRSYRGRYLVLIAGERRLRACRMLQREGCTDHRPRGCYRLHTGDERVKATVCFGVQPFDVLELQASENIHLRLPLYEEAEFYDRYYRFLCRARGEVVSLAEFGRRVGRSYDMVRDALRFVQLPEQVREHVSRGEISYSNACILARLKAEGLEDTKIVEWATRMMVNPPTRGQLREQVRRKLDELRGSNQLQLLEEIFADEAEKDFAKMLRRKSIDRGSVVAFHSSIRYFLRVLSLFERGVLGYPHSPFSMRGPLQAWRKTLVLLRDKLLPHFERVLAEYPSVGDALHRKVRPVREGSKILAEAERLTEELERKVPMAAKV